MILELVSAGTHGNQTAVYKCYDGELMFYLKSALAWQANKRIANEKRGYDWFYDGTPTKQAVTLVENYFNELRIPGFRGKTFTPSASIEGNEKYIEIVIETYTRKWLSARNHLTHGDMALCNIIIEPNRTVYIVDWEHCHKTSMDTYGFDIINLLFMTLYSRLRPNRISRLTSRSRSFLRTCYRYLTDVATSSNEILEKPFQNAGAYFQKNINNFRLNVDVGTKFLLAVYSQDVLQKLDLIVTRS